MHSGLYYFILDLASNRRGHHFIYTFELRFISVKQGEYGLKSHRANMQWGKLVGTKLRQEKHDRKRNT